MRARTIIKQVGILNVFLSLIFSLAGCSNGSGGGSKWPPPVIHYTIGGSISGLTASGLELAGAGQTVSPAANATSFTFPTAVATGTSYTVTVQTQPSGLTCSLSSNTGTVGTSNVTSIQVSCVANPTYTISGSISGLMTSGLELLTNNETVSPDAKATAFTFPTGVASGVNYSVTVQTQPSGLSCSVLNGTGTVGSSNVTNVQIACSAASLFVLYNFGNGTTDANGPSDSLLMDSSGNFYGTSRFGGNGTTGGLGTVFKVSPGKDGVYTDSVLYAFGTSGLNDGMQPVSNVIMDSQGNIYGTTMFGGFYEQDINKDDFGIVFKLIPNGDGTYTENVILDLYLDPAGISPMAGLIMDSSGNLYGTTSNAGPGDGSVFELTPSGGGSYTETILHGFHSVPDGANPYGGLTVDSSGNFYGTTQLGGTGQGYGTIYKLTPSGGGTYTESILYSFQGGNDGEEPESSVIMDGSGNIYGTTYGGGTNGNGTVYKLSPDGHGGYTESVLVNFAGTLDGAHPSAGLVMDKSGNLYGTAAMGGISFGSLISDSYGTVYKLSPNGDGSYTESVLHVFVDTDGSGPIGGLILDSSGNLYGTTGGGGTYNGGTLYKISQ